MKSQRTFTTVERARQDTLMLFGEHIIQDSCLRKQEVAEMAARFDVAEMLYKAKEARADAGLV